jgi:hypothetical protein
MRTLAFSVILLLVAGCTIVTVKPMSAAEVVQLSKDGKSPKEIIQALESTNTVLPLRASDYVALHEAGVSKEVLDYLQLAQLEEVRWRERRLYGYGAGWGPYYGRGGPWGCGYGRWGC